jgi:hypothetical protein
MKSWKGVIGFLNMVLLATVMASALSSMHLFIHDQYEMTTNVFAFIFSSQAFFRALTAWINQVKWRELKAFVIEPMTNLTPEEKNVIIKMKKLFRLGFITTVFLYYVGVYFFAITAAFSSNEYEMPLNFQIPFTK